jgi:predicted nucleotide-binding protein
MTDKLTRPLVVLQELFAGVIAKGDQLSGQIFSESPSLSADALENWDNQAKTLLAGSFTGPDPAMAYPRDFDRQYFTGTTSTDGDRLRVRAGFGARLMALRSIADLLPLYEEPSAAILSGREHPASRLSKAIFIVHGHAEGPKHEVARYLENSSNATPIILHEQAKRGLAIIEQLEEYAATAAFAIVLLTADDHGGAVRSGEDRARARQNVVFELGFFIGALGRSRVAVLYQESVELPSDMSGILYTVLDSPGAWKIGLGRELRTAGFAVDLNVAT